MWLEPVVMSINAVDVVNAATLEKVVLTQRVATFLSDQDAGEKRAAIENVARMLAQDISLQVREALAFELRTCKLLPHDLAAKIASDVASVASPFLANTEAFSDVQLAGLIPHLEEHAHITIARRSDVGPHTCFAIVSVGSDKSVSFLVRNDQVTLPGDVSSTVVSRFGMSRDMMDLLAQRADLPLTVVEAIIDKVSDACREQLAKQYGISTPMVDDIARNTKSEAVWRQIEKASPAQIHGYVIDLRKSERLTPDMILEFSSRGCLSFLESAIALDAGLTLGAVREALYGGDTTAFVRVMQAADVSKATAHEYLQIVKKFGD
jgi:uncharacterized protein (DUF2336 family)